MSALHANSYKLIARSLGRSLAYIMTDQGLTVAPLAFVVTAKSLRTTPASMLNGSGVSSRLHGWESRTDATVHRYHRSARRLLEGSRSC